MEAIVLAGGIGSRLKSVVTGLPKVMAPVNGKPFLVYVLDYLKSNGVSRVILSVGYKRQMIQDYFRDSYSGMEIIYSIEDDLLGTGGAVKKSLSYSEENTLFVVNGDTLFSVNLKDLLDLHHKKDSDITLSLKVMDDFSRYGVVQLNDDLRVMSFQEKKYRKEGSINGGVYCIKRELFDMRNLPEKFMLEEFLEDNISNVNMFGFLSNEYFIDIGIPEDYQRAQEELAS